MKIKKLLALTLALSMTGAVLASCGDDSSSSSAAETTTTTTTTAAADASSAEDSSAADASSEDASSADASSADASSEDGSSEAAPASNYTPVTEFKGYDAFLMFGDYDWLWGNWNPQCGDVNADKGAYGIDADITGDGEYTVAISADSLNFEDAKFGKSETNAEAGPATGTVVFCVDIEGICDGSDNYKGEAQEKNALADGDDYKTNKKTKGLYASKDITCEVTSIKCDGQEIKFDPSKIVYGNIETDNNCYRIEIYNMYGVNAADPAIDPDDIYAEDKIEVTFKISGLNKEG